MANRMTDTVARPDSSTETYEATTKGPATNGDAVAGNSRRPPRTASATPNGRSRKGASSAAGGMPAKATSKAPRLQGRSKVTANAAATKRAVTKGIEAAPILGEGTSTTADVVVPVKQGAPGTLRQHAVPAALVGAAVAWYLLQTKPAKSAEARLLERAKRAATVVGGALSDAGETAGVVYHQATGTTRDAIGVAAGSVGHAAGTTAEAVQHGASALAGYARSGATTAGEALKNGAEFVGQTTKAGYQRTQQAVVDSWERHPLAVGASLLAAGVTAGMFLPAPRQSGALLTRASADLSRKVSAKANQLIEKGRSAVGLASAVARPAPATTAKGRQRPRARAAS